MQQVCFYFEGSLPLVFVQFCGEGNIQHVIFQHPAKFRSPKAPVLQFLILSTLLKVWISHESRLLDQIRFEKENLGSEFKCIFNLYIYQVHFYKEREAWGGRQHKNSWRLGWRDCTLIYISRKIFIQVILRTNARNVHV